MTLRTGAILSMGLAVVAILFPGTNGGATKASQQAPSAELIVTTAWLAEHLDDPNVVVLAPKQAYSELASGRFATRKLEA